MTLHFAKGHGTGNDFVLVPDAEGDLALDEAHVRLLCDRRFGIGGDGLIRVVRSERAAQAPDPAVRATTGAPEWFMDYRNADGSVADMCGNGARVFARYLVDAGLARPGRLEILTRAGVRVVYVPVSGDIAVDMGAPVRTGWPDTTAVMVGGETYSAVPLGMPNPHAVIFLPDLEALPQTLPLPAVDLDVFPDGANVEFAAGVNGRRGHVTMRVHERGVGETLSCGTGACAVAVVAAERWDLDALEPIHVTVPGGRLTVTRYAGGGVRMAGPAVIVADGRLRGGFWPEAVPDPGEQL